MSWRTCVVVKQIQSNPMTSVLQVRHRLLIQLHPSILHSVTPLIPHFRGWMITCPCWNSSNSMLVKWAPCSATWHCCIWVIVGSANGLLPCGTSYPNQCWLNLNKILPWVLCWKYPWHVFFFFFLGGVGWVGLWGFLWWAPSAKGKDHHGVSSGWSSVWQCSNTGLSSTQYEQIPITRTPDILP